MSFIIEKFFEQNKLDAQAETFLRKLNDSEQIDFKSITIPEFKITANKLLNETYKSRKHDKVGKIDNLKIVKSEEEIPIRIYTPAGKGPFPVFYFIHGGGWMVGGLESHDNICRAFCNRADCIVVAVDYKLSPEYKFPAGLNDASAVLEWIINNIHSYNGISSGIAIGGDSAGGNLAAALTIKYANSEKYNIIFQMLFYPSLDISSFNTESFELFKEGYRLTKEIVKWYANKYLANDKDKYNILASPLLNQNISNLPPACIITAEYDVLRDEGEEYAYKLSQAGIPVKCIRFGGLIHAFLNMDGIINKVDTVFSNIAELLQINFKKYLSL